MRQDAGIVGRLDDEQPDWPALHFLSGGRCVELQGDLMRSLLMCLMLIATTAGAQTPDSLSLEEFQSGGPPPAQLLMLGTFHFMDAGMDDYKPEVDVDVLSERRQREVEEVVERLARFRPTKIMLEAQGPVVEKLHERYEQYLAGEYELGANEIYQLGFRLGKRLGLERLDYVDAWGRHYEEFKDPDAWQEALAQCGPVPENHPWEERFTALYRHDDHAKADRTLRETLLAMNEEDRIIAGHGHYVIGRHTIQCGEHFPGADGLTGWWYNRNIRIFSVMRTLTRVPEDRVLLIIGAGHLPILRHMAQASPEYRLHEVEDFLGD